jgi:hypothetical protein
MTNTGTISLVRLRKAIRENRVSFPAQVPLFVRSAPQDLQCHSVQLYFLRGWTCEKIAKRYGYSRFYIWRIVNEWKQHATSAGYIQAIPPASILTELKKALARTSYKPAA